MRHFLVILFLLITQGGFTQNEANIWYFGEYAGLDFNSGAPVALLNSAMVMDEGVSTISDANGNLLFYTNGIDVWNRNHQKMPNGTGLNGHSSSTNSGFIVPKPGSTTTYYIFTTDAFFGPLGLCYSVVDMTLQAGLGDVTQKNLFLHSPVTEKIAAIEHANGQDLWVVTHQGNSNVFQSWLVTSSGVSTTPVTTNIGTVHSNANSGNGIGYIKFSPDGKQLALTIYGLGVIALFDFDAAVGTFSNAQTFPGTWDDVYGIEFSPNGKLLYVSSDTVLLQFDLTAGTLNDIVNTQTRVGGIGQMPMAFIAPVQLGPDRKIYWGVYYSDYLGVVNDPNQPGLACNSVAQGVSLGGRHSLSGLPVFVASLFYAKPFHYVNTCLEDTTHFWTNDSLSFDSVTWNFGDPVSGIYNTASLFAPTHIYTTTGTFTVTMIVFKGLLTDTMIQTIAITDIIPVHLGPDKAVCASAPVSLNAGTGYDQYLWHDSSTAQNYTATVPGIYWVTVKKGDCYSSDTVLLFPCPTGETNLYIPNAFTPNGDNNNDVFFVVGNDIIDFSIIIYNRWGGAVFKTKDMDAGWDGTFEGKPVPEGVYFYTISFSVTGNPDKVTERKGSVLLLR